MEYKTYKNTVDRMISRQIVYASAGFVVASAVLLALGWSIPIVELLAVWLIVCLAQIVGVMGGVLFLTLYRSWNANDKK